MPLLDPINNIRHFVDDPLLFIKNNHVDFGEFFSLYLGHKRIHFACHPDLATQILSTQVDCYKKSRLIFDKIKPITGKYGLVQLEGSQWEEMRNITSDIFHGKNYDQYINVMNTYADRLVSEVNHQALFYGYCSLSSLMIKYTINVAVKIFIGIDNNDAIATIAEKFVELNQLCGMKMRKIISPPLWLPIGINIRINVLRNDIRHLISNLISSAPASQHVSLLTLLSEQLKNHKNKHTLIIDQIMTFIFAGYETTAASLTFCFLLLAKHQEEQDKVYHQIKLQTSEYVQAVYREALRLYPPAYILAREVTKETQLADMKLKPGDNLILSVYEIHRHSLFWTDPNQFMPERFLKSYRKNMHKFSFIPFGYGKRVCSGMNLAMIEAKIIIEKLIKHFKFSVSEQSLFKTESMVTLHPKDDVKLIVEIR